MQQTMERLPGLSRLTLGTVQLGMPYGIRNRDGMPSEQSGRELLNFAWEGGITAYDTASAYGMSEALLGDYFADRGVAPLIVTKIHPKPEPTAGAAQVERLMRELVEASLKRLRLSSLPVLMLHNTDVMERFGDAVTAAFESMKREGLIGRAGISVGQNTEAEYRMLRDYLRDGTYDTVQLPMNVLDHRPLANGCLAMLAEAGKAVFVRSVFLQGLLYMQDEELPANLVEAREPLARLRELSARYGMPVAQMAVSFIRDLEGVDSLVIGAETKEQVRDNLALIGGPPLPEPLRQELLQSFVDVPEKVVTPHLWKR